MAHLYIVESLALGMSPYSLSMVEVCFMVSVTVCEKIAMSAFNMCVIKLESLYVLHLSVHIMALQWEFKKKMFLLPVQIVLVQYFVPFITTYLGSTRCWSGKIYDTCCSSPHFDILARKHCSVDAT